MTDEVRNLVDIGEADDEVSAVAKWIGDHVKVGQDVLARLEWTKADFAEDHLIGGQVVRDSWACEKAGVRSLARLLEQGEHFGRARKGGQQENQAEARH